MAIPSHYIARVLNFVHPKLEQHKQTDEKAPFVLGLSGLQGSGKSTWAESLADALRTRYDYNVIVLSLDDLYHNHYNLVRAREADVSNGLLRTRGQPGTHDEALAKTFFDSLNGVEGSQIRIPSFDKSRFDGEGDRAPQEQWRNANLPVDILIFEGWCMGFKAIPEAELEAKATEAKQQAAQDLPDGFSVHTLSRHSLSHLQAINENLRRYNETFMKPTSLDYLIHLDTDDLSNVYRWRLDQEHALWQKRGSGMADEAVIKFVQGYMPAYELYLETLKQKPFVISKSERQDSPTQRTQLRILLGTDRSISEMSELR